MMRKVVLVMILLILFAKFLQAQSTSSSEGIVVNNLNPPFKLVIPAGLVEMPIEVLKAQNNWVYGFVEEGISTDNIVESILVGVSLMGGPIARESPEILDNLVRDARKALPSGAEVELEKIKVLDLTMHAIVAHYVMSDKDVVSIGVSIPLKPEAIMLVFMAPVSKEYEVRVLMEEILGSIQGKSNWFTAKEQIWAAVYAVVGIAMIFLNIYRKKLSKTHNM